MTQVLITRSKLDSLAAAVSAKSNKSVPLTIDEMTAAVQSIPVDKQPKIVTPTTSQQVVVPDTGFFGLSQVTVNAIPSNYIIPTGNVILDTNGTNIDIAQYSTATVSVAGSGNANNQIKTVSPT